MANSENNFFRGWPAKTGQVKAELPDAVNGFNALFQSTMKEGALSVREKEYVALGMAIVLRCEPCIYLHVKKCIEAGASREQVLEVAGVAVMMQGGPGYTYLPKILEALEALKQSVTGAGQ